MIIKTIKVMTSLSVALVVGTSLAVGTYMVYRAAAKPKLNYTEPPTNPEPKGNSS